MHLLIADHGDDQWQRICWDRDLTKAQKRLLAASLCNALNAVIVAKQIIRLTIDGISARSFFDRAKRRIGSCGQSVQRDKFSEGRLRFGEIAERT